MQRKYFMALLLVVLTSVAGLTAYAQTATQAPQDQTDATDSSTQTSGQPGGQSSDQTSAAAPTDDDAADDATDADVEEAADGSARFIPTEQVSQDLGVSFPVDI